MTNNSTRLGAHIPLIYHFAMLQDQQRMEGFKEAIEIGVPLGSRVLELGGGTGVLSFFAAQRASKVYCVECIPENASAARKLLSQNPNGNKVEVICADAFDYLPPEPVDVVICEMLHVGMVREKQIPVIESFKKRYREKFGDKLPRFIPEAFIQGIQAISYDFNFFGYSAAIPFFQQPGYVTPNCIEIGDPLLFQLDEYKNALPDGVNWKGKFAINKNATFNAVRVILKNVLAIEPKTKRAVHWHNHYLIIPLLNPITVNAGAQVNVGLNYNYGCEIEDLQKSISISLAQKPQRLVDRIERVVYEPAVQSEQTFEVIPPQEGFLPPRTPREN